VPIGLARDIWLEISLPGRPRRGQGIRDWMGWVIWLVDRDMEMEMGIGRRLKECSIYMGWVKLIAEGLNVFLGLLLGGLRSDRLSKLRHLLGFLDLDVFSIVHCLFSIIG